MEGKCPNSPFNEIIPATTICGEDDFLFIRVLTHPLLIYESFETPSSYLLLVLTSYLFTTFSGFPAAYACKLPIAIFIKRSRASNVAHAICGVI